jgi:DMSO/TMAO reductase YedYZ molybdopterin-dependent catalytic subunit
MITRRTLIAGSAATLLAGCDKLSNSESFRGILRSSEGLTMRAQRLISDRAALAREFSAADISPIFRANGTRLQVAAYFVRLAARAFADWGRRVDGLVRQPLSLSIDQIRRMPRQTQITRHDCVEGWSAIGKWTGVPLRLILDAAGIAQQTRYIVFHCADLYGDRPYYESIDMIDALHPQTILAWALNDRYLQIPNGAPLRLRVERQLGYKHAKYLMRIEARETLAGLWGGRGGYWEDSNDYEWYAGI